MRIFLMICSVFLGLAITSSLVFAEEKKPVFQIFLSIPPEPILSVTPDQQKSGLEKRYIRQNPYKKPNFYVVLKNISTTAQKIWSEDCSWGYENLYFKITNGNTVFVKKAPVIWSGNVPQYLTIRPNDFYVIPVSITPETWLDFPTIKDGTNAIKLKAFYKNTLGNKDWLVKTFRTKDLENFWEGEVESDPIEVTITPWF